MKRGRRLEAIGIGLLLLASPRIAWANQVPGELVQFLPLALIVVIFLLVVVKSTTKSPSGKIIWGIAWALVGLFIYLWASRHSPYNPLGAMMAGGLENYVLKEPFYTVILLVAAGLGLLGISQLVLGLIDRAKPP
jgi:hypothetical protein